MRRLRSTAVGAAATVVATLLATLLATVPPAAADAVVAPDHVVVVVLENHSATQVLGNPDAPYINSLAANGALMTQSYAVTHPSEPNYLALFSGSTQGLVDDSCPHTYSAPSLGGSLLAAGRTFAGYSEDQPTAGYTGCISGNYARKHNPWVDFTDVPPGSNLPLTAFPSDFADLPTVAFVVPNLQNDMHDGTVAQGDLWVQDHLGAYVTWARQHNSQLVLTFDEDDNRTGNLIPTIVAGAGVVPGSYAERVDHYGVLRTLENELGLPALGLSADATGIQSIWGTPSNLPPTATVTVSTQGLTATLDASASSDPDGSVVGWSWSFSDGGTATGPVVTHSSSAPGSYQATVRVTDDHGAVSVFTKVVSVSAPGAADSFGRTVSGGWGSADVGGAWTVAGGASAFSVDGARGLVRLGAGSGPAAYLNAVASTDTDLRMTLSTDRSVAVGTLYASLIGRRVVGSGEYRVKVMVAPSGSVNLMLRRTTGSGAEAYVGPGVTVPGVVFGPTSAVALRLQVTGVNPTVLRAKAWAAGGVEPVAWVVTGTDAEPSLQRAGGVGIAPYLTSTATNAPVTLGLDDLTTGGPVAPPPPPNTAPTAAFSAVATGLSVAFDGSGSRDTDGSVVGWSWSFGDGGTATGAAPTHLFAAGGTFAVTLTVTDDRGGTGVVTHDVTVTAPSGLAADSFGRTVSGGWGSADVGGAWTVAGGASAFSVDGARGLVRLGAGSGPAAYLNAVASTDTDLRMTLSTDRSVAVGTLYASLIGRRVVGSGEYRVKVMVAPSGSVNLMLRRTTGSGAEAYVGPGVTVPGVVFGPTSAVALRLQVTGVNPTVLRAKAWAAGGVEPVAWVVTGTDAEPSLQRAGGVGIAPYLTSTATNAPVTLGLDDLRAQ